MAEIRCESVKHLLGHGVVSDIVGDGKLRMSSAMGEMPQIWNFGSTQNKTKPALKSRNMI